MAYSTDILKNRVTVLNRTATRESSYGSGAAGYTWTEAGTLWASVTWTKGSKALHEGALDAYDSVMIRTRYTDILTRNSRIKYDGATYQIDSFHADYEENTIQITATEMANT